MLILKPAGLAIATVLVLASFTLAQDDGHFDVSLGYGGVFSKTSTSSLGGVTLKPTTSGAILATFRYRFNHVHGLAVNLGHTSNSQVFSVPPDSFRVKAGITEYTAAYVLSPFRTSKLQPFLLGGAGALRFSAGNQYIDGFLSPFGAANQTALTFLYGGGADYRLWRVFALRLQYRGLIYKAPDFRLSGLFTGAKGHMAEPSAGVVVRF